jgi:hypothetical protein
MLNGEGQNGVVRYVLLGSLATAFLYVLSFFVLVNPNIPAHGAGGIITYPYSSRLAGGYPGKDENGMSRVEARESVLNWFYFPVYFIFYGSADSKDSGTGNVAPTPGAPSVAP